MARRRDPGTKADTKLARVRMARGVTQQELAEVIGISLVTYRRLERGSMDNPPLRYLQNAALAPGVGLEALWEDEWRTWKPFDSRRPKPPRPEDFWREPAVND
ncbi:MAG: helix-turn-helix domain-containing protein [Thermoleophilaceae bacterium]